MVDELGRMTHKAGRRIITICTLSCACVVTLMLTLMLALVPAAPALAATPTYTPPYAAGPQQAPCGGCAINPEEITIGPDGNAWYTDGGSYIYEMPTSGPDLGAAVYAQAEPSIGSSPSGIVEADGALWFTETQPGEIGCFTMNPMPTVESYLVAGSSAGDLDGGITVGPDGNLWFTEVTQNKIGQLVPWTTVPAGSPWKPCPNSPAALNQYPVTGATLGPATASDTIASGPGGNLWFVESGSEKIGEMTTSGQLVNTFPAGAATLSGTPLGIAEGADGDIWFTESTGVIGNVTPAGAVTQFTLPQSISDPWNIISGPDGNLWFTYTTGATNAGVGCINAEGNAAAYPVSTQGSNPDGLALVDESTIWVLEGNGSSIDTLAPVACGAPTGPPACTTQCGEAGQPSSGNYACVVGSWSNSPTGYTYQWYLDGTPIQGATGATYKPPTDAEGTTLTCSVAASGAGGTSAPVTGKGTYIPVPHVARCPGATGSLSGQTLGLARLGMTRAQAVRAYTRSSNRGKHYEVFFCLTPIGVRIGIASPVLLDTLRKPQRRQLAGRVIWASTSSYYYAVQGVRVGATVAAAEKTLKLAGPFHVGLNNWYLAPNGASTAVFKVRDDVIEEIGIGDKALTETHKAQLAFLKSFS